MRAVVAFVVIICLASAGAAKAGISISWSDCGTSANHAKVTGVTWTPSNPVAGDNVTITGTGTLDKAMTAEKGTLLFAGIIPADFDGCAGAVIKAPFNLATITFPPAGCPVKAGSLMTKRYVAISSSLPKGKTTTKLTTTDQDGEPVLCVDMTLENS